MILTRSPRPGGPHRQVAWDGATVGSWKHELADAVLVNLAGELADRRLTAANVELLTRSRVVPTQTLARAAAELSKPPVVWIQLSGLGIYGEGGEAVIDEQSPPAGGSDQLADVARAWEQAVTDAPAGRQVILRTAVVLDAGTPALNRLTSLIRWGLGGRMGTGRQWFSWLHIADFLAIVDRVVDDPALSGVIHATSPYPVRNKELMASLRQVLRRPWAPPTPAPLVKVGALLLRTDPALALTGRRCVPGQLQAAGFNFAYPELVPALEDLLKAKARP